MNEGESGIQYQTGCPHHGTKFLYRANIDGFWYELCSAQNCGYQDIVTKERKQKQPIPFEDRRKNDD